MIRIFLTLLIALASADSPTPRAKPVTISSELNYTALQAGQQAVIAVVIDLSQISRPIAHAAGEQLHPAGGDV